MGTENVLVRGPKPAYVELIAAGRDDSNPWLDRVRCARGPISWAVAVDDIDVARTSLVDAGFTPSPVVDGSRRTPGGDLVEWRLCDVGDGPYDGSLPFLLEWTTPMEPGPADGPIFEHVSLTPPDPDLLADLLVAVGFVPSRHWPRRMFQETGGSMTLTLGPLAEPEDLDSASWTMSWGDPVEEPPVTITLRVPRGELTRHTLDGVAVTTYPDRRRFAGAALLPAVDEVFCRLSGASAEPPLVLRADAWVEAISAAGLGAPERADDPSWASHSILGPARVARLRGPVGTQPVTVVWGGHSGVEGTVVVVGIGDPVEVLERQPEWGSPGPAYELGRLDDAFVLALSGGVYAVREGPNTVVIRALDGWGSTDTADGEAERWLAEAADGRTDGVLRGDAWL